MIKLLLDSEDLPGMEMDEKELMPLYFFDAKCRKGRVANFRSWINWKTERGFHAFQQIVFEFYDVDCAKLFMQDERHRLALLGDPLNCDKVEYIKECYVLNLTFPDKKMDFETAGAVQYWDGNTELGKFGSESTILFTARNGLGVSRVVLKAEGSPSDLQEEELNRLLSLTTSYAGNAGIRF